MPARLPSRKTRKYGRIFEPAYNPNASSAGLNVFGGGAQYGGFAYQPNARPRQQQPAAYGGFQYRPQPVMGEPAQPRSFAWTPPSNLSESDWLRMTQGYAPYSEDNPQWGGYWTGSGIDYGLSNLNFERTFEDQDALEAQGLGNTMNRYGQPIGTVAPLNYTQSWSSPQFATGRRAITPELLQQSYKQVDNYIKNWRKSGKAGSYTAARNSRQLALLKRRKGIIEALAKANNVDLGGGGDGTSPAWVGNIASWNI